MDIAGYLDEIRKVYDTGVASEHSYRPALESLFQGIDPELDVINEPRRVDVGAPDFVFQRDGVARGWCEHKDIDKDVVKPKGYSKEQKERYTQGLPNLLYTNGLDFEFIRDGQQTAFITIADYAHGLPGNPDQFEKLETYLTEFAAARPLSIRSAKRLAELMAGKAKLIKEALGGVLKADPELQSELANQFKSFKANLLPNLTPGEFADIYAETVTYGMFAARFHDQTPDDFSRQEALELLPKSNPFLRSMFQFVAGYDLDDRIAWIVDDLAALLQACNVHDLFKDYGKWDARNDPFIHFYEDFLGAYNPKKRKSRGVWYTPEPVVDFIVRAVDDVLKEEFGLPDGLADTSKVTVDWDTGLTGKKGEALTEKREVHRVQILDPATGTGTFLAKATQLISDRVKGVAPGAWSNYVEKELLPRLHGFELLMASYAMCHMKLDMQLTESGYTPSANPPRLSVWLTNALEPAERVKSDLFWTPLAKEAEGAADVKRQTPIMCVIGNPPYSVSSSNQGDHINTLLMDYKQGLSERNIQPLSDDYVKFIRLAHSFVEQNRAGVLAFITNNSFLDGAVHRQMRRSLMEAFDQIWIVDLHGSSKKKETAPDGGVDQNVFDIMQGVSIIIAVRTAKKNQKTFGRISHVDLWGTRKSKNAALSELSLCSSEFAELEAREPKLFFVPKNYDSIELYEQGFSLTSLFDHDTAGINTHKDRLVVDFDRNRLREKMVGFFDPANLEADLFDLFGVKSSKTWSLETARAGRAFDERLLVRYAYRPFDNHHVYYDRQIVERDRFSVMRNILELPNIGLAMNRQIEVKRDFSDSLVVDAIFDRHGLSLKEGNQFAPLYLYPDEDAAQKDALAPTERTVNFDPKLCAKICEAAGIDPADTDMAREKNSASAEPVEAQATRLRDPSTSSGRTGGSAGFRTATGDARPSEVKVFDYIYGVLHSPDYRETFAEFLKIDFPRIPYPASPEVFAHISEKGEALRRLHLMEPAAIGDTAFPFMGDVEDDEERDVVASGYPKRDDGHVWINKHQYFQNVPESAWSFYIGGYQPAQKWLKDRKGRRLEFPDLQHYQRIVKILLETDRIMREIELPLEVEG